MTTSPSSDPSNEIAKDEIPVDDSIATEGRSRSPRPMHTAVPWIVLALGVLLTVWGWYSAREFERAAADSRFASQVRDRNGAFRAELRYISSVLEDVRLFLDHGGVIDQESFGRFTLPLLEREDAFLALSWNPWIVDAERTAFEARGPASEPNFQITQRATPEGAIMVRAPQRSEYSPVLWIEPREPYKTAFGFDVLSESTRREAFERALQARALAVTAPIAILGDEDARFGVLVFLPRFTQTAENDSVFAGMVVGVLRVDDIFARALSQFEAIRADLELWDISEPSQPMLIFQRLAPGGSKHDGKVREENPEHGGAIIPWGGRLWATRAFPTAAYMRDQESSGPMVGLIAGLVVSLAFSGYLLTLTTQRKRAEILVQKRTRELGAVNERLRSEATQRIAAQQELNEHQVRLEDIVDDRTSELVQANASLVSEVERRKQAEEALSEGNQRLQLTLEAITEGVGDWDIKSGRVFLSDRTLEALEYDGKAITNPEERARIWRDSLHPDDFPARAAALQRCIEGVSDHFDLVVRRTTRTGECRWFQDWGKVVARDPEGRALRVLATTRDVTRRTLAEQEKERLDERMREAQKLESLGVLSGGIAHDFNNLLAGILGNVELALEESRENPKISPLLSEVRLASGRAAELVHQMLAYSGQAPFKKERLDLAQVLEEMLSLLTSAISKKAELVLDIKPALTEGDPVQLRQVVMNLITNASDALQGEAGKIELVTGTEEVTAVQLGRARINGGLTPGTYPFLTVGDSGVGMDEKVLSQMFDPFFTTKFTGRGLGLAATLGIVKGHGGALSVHSTPGKGTTARVILPNQKARSRPADRIQPSPTVDSFEPATILVVDDEPALRMLIKKSLERFGLTVLEAGDGLHGLDVLSKYQEEIDLVIVDATMPVMDGAQFLAAVRDFCDVPVIITSGHAESTLQEQLAGSQMTAFLPKPFQLQDLLGLVAKELNNTDTLE